LLLYKIKRILCIKKLYAGSREQTGTFLNLPKHTMTQKITVLTYVVYKFLKLRVKELFVKRGDLDAYIKLDEEYERLDILFDKTFKSRK
jgi:hypothetical protein